MQGGMRQEKADIGGTKSGCASLGSPAPWGTVPNLERCVQQREGLEYGLVAEEGGFQKRKVLGKASPRMNSQHEGLNIKKRGWEKF